MLADGRLLEGVSLFQGLDPDERQELAAVVDEASFAAGALLFRRGDPGGCLHVVVSGRVEISTVDSTGVKFVLETAGPGDFFGELSLLDGQLRSTDAVALEDTTTILVDRSDLLALFRKHPDAALDVLAVTGRRLREADRLLRYRPSRSPNDEVETRRTPIERLADLLAAWSGSLPFLLLHAAWFAAWIAVNVGLTPFAAFDPFPFGLLTMIVSLEAIFLSCFVLISQRRQAAKDQIRSEAEYEANIKAALEVSELHVKVDRLHEDAVIRLDALERRRP